MAALPASASIINVPDEYQTIQEGINASEDGDTVLVAPGVYAGTGNVGITTAGKAIVVMGGQGAVNTVIDGEGSYSGFNITNSEDWATVIEGFTIRNITYGIYCILSYPTIKSTIFENFLSQGIHVDGYSSDPPIAPFIEDCLFNQKDQNYQGTGVGIYVYRSAEVTISGCKFSNSRVGLEFHGGSNLRPDFEVIDCVIRDNALYGIWTHS